MHTKRNLKLLLTVLAMAAIAVLTAAFASASPLLSEETRFRQTDGQAFLATPCGDERCHYFKTADGDVLLQGSGGAWYYAELRQDGGENKLVPTAAKYLIDAKPESAATEDAVRSAPALLGNAQYAPAPAAPAPQANTHPYLGEQSVLVLLVEFNDAAIQHEAEWADHVFGLGQRSARDYFRSSTMGKIDLVPAQESYGTANDGVVRVKLGRNHPNCAGELNWGSPGYTRLGDALAAAVQAAGSYVNFKSYDTNRNGWIDMDELHMVVVFAGYEHAYYPDETIAPSIWAHRGDFGEHSGKILVQGLRFRGYAALGEADACWSWDGENETEFLDAHMATIGVLVHELGHDMALPDFYDQPGGTDLGGFSVMAGGNWGTIDGLPSGSIPVGFDPWCLEELGVVTPQIVSEGQSYSGILKSISTGQKNVLKLPIGNEYFLIENRQLEGYDRSLPLYDDGYWDDEAEEWVEALFGGGLLVYRVYPHGYYPIVGLVGEYWEMPYFAQDRRFTRLNDTMYPYTRLQSGRCAWFDMLPEDPSDTEMRLSITPLSRFTITYIDDYYWNAPAPQTKAKGETITLSAYDPPKIGGWCFYGWTPFENEWDMIYQPGDAYSGDGGLVLYALWYNLSFLSLQESRSTLVLPHKSVAQLHADYPPELLKWTSECPRIATVDANGRVTSRYPGTVLIYAEGANGVKDWCVVKVTYAWWQYIIYYLLFGWTGIWGWTGLF